MANALAGNRSNNDGAGTIVIEPEPAVTFGHTWKVSPVSQAATRKLFVFTVSSETLRGVKSEVRQSAVKIKMGLDGSPMIIGGK